MGSEWIIGALAFVTIGVVAGIAIYHFEFFLKDPHNKKAAANIGGGGKAATTQVAEDAADGTYHDRTLKERLDDSALSKHPHDPHPAEQGVGA